MAPALLFVAFLLFVIAAVYTVPALSLWHRLVAGGLAFLAAGLGALSIIGVS